MKRTLISMAALALCAAMATPVKRARTRDVAFSFRMGAGFPGDVNRTHPASILPGLMNATNPVAFYGFPVIIDSATSSYRGMLATDDAVTKIDGILVRPFPTQQTSGGMTSTLGAAVPPTTGVIDVLEDGFIIAKCNAFGAAPPTKGGAVYVWTAPSAGNHVLGGFEAAAGAVGETAVISNAYWNGPADSAGITEIQVFRK